MQRAPIADKAALQNKIDYAISVLRELGIVEKKGSSLTQTGIQISNLPNFGTAQMAKAVHSGITKHGCGYEMILYAAQIMTNEKSIQDIIKFIPTTYHHESGDIFTLILFTRDLYEQYTQQCKNKKDFQTMVNICKHFTNKEQIAQYFFRAVCKAQQYQASILKSPKNAQHIKQQYK